jgi:predicted MFS family arabinose efflux permease
VTLVTVSDLYLVPPLLPNFISRFHVELASAGWIAGSYHIGAAIMTLIAGLLADRYGCRFVLVLSMGLFGLGEALAGAAGGFPIFLAGRALVGSGSAAASLALTTYIGCHVPYESRGKTMGWIGSAYFAAVAFGPLVGTQIADRTSLDLLLAIYSVFALVGAVHSWFTFERDASVTGAVGWKSFRPIASNSGFWGIVVAQALFSIGVVSMIQFFGDWLKVVFGLGTQARGVLFAVGGIPSLAGSPIGGWVCDRLGKKPFLILATGVLAVLTCVMPYLNFSQAAVVGLFGLVGFVAAARYSALHALTTRLVEPSLLGRLVSLRNFATYASTAGGLVMMGNIYASSPSAGFIRMGWLASLFLIVSAPILVWLVPSEPRRGTLATVGS